MENSTITKDVEIASKTSRLLAFLIDNLIIQTIFFSYIYFIEDITFWNYLDKEFDLFNTLTGTLIALIYGSLIYPIFSGNIGHRIMGLKVVNIENKSNFNTFYEGAFREFIKDFCIILIIPNLWILFDKKNQNIYDKIFKTIVVKR
jgi:uncharacterized RDD family membrane protein YckC